MSPRQRISTGVPVSLWQKFMGLRPPLATARAGFQVPVIGSLPRKTQTCPPPLAVASVHSNHRPHPPRILRHSITHGIVRPSWSVAVTDADCLQTRQVSGCPPAVPVLALGFFTQSCSAGVPRSRADAASGRALGACAHQEPTWAGRIGSLSRKTPSVDPMISQTSEGRFRLPALWPVRRLGSPNPALP